MKLLLHKNFLFTSLALHAALLGYACRRLAPVTLEPAHLVAGVSEWKLGKFHVFHVNPPLVRLVATLPLLWQSPKFDPKEYDRPLIGREEREMGVNFIVNNSLNARRLLTVSRWACVVFCLSGAYFSWRMASTLYGPCAGSCALAMWCFSPYILGHGATIMPDVPSAALGLAAVYYFWRWLKKPQWPAAVAAGVVLGLAELCKFTLLIFYPLLPVLWVGYRLPEWKTAGRRDLLGQGVMLVAALLVSVYIVNCGYFFEGTFTRLGEFRFQSMVFTGSGSLKDVPLEGANRFAGTWLGRLPVLLPANMVQGIDTQRYDFERGLPSYLRGERSPHGWWYYYLYALTVKVPLGTWCLVALAFGVTVFGRGHSAAWRDEMIVLAPLLTIFVFVSSQTGFSVHSRYVIPVLPFMFVWTSKVARVSESGLLPSRRPILTTIITLALTWSLGSSLSIYPYSLSYFNELAAVLPTPADALYPKPFRETRERHGLMSWVNRLLTAGPCNGPRHLLDSNLDWGQDLFFLEDWYESHPEARPIKVVYLGDYPLELSKITPAGQPPFGPDVKQPHGRPGAIALSPLPGWYALSVNDLYGQSDRYHYFLYFEPTAMAGYSIYIYHITIDKANRARRKLGMVELPKDWRL